MTIRLISPDGPSPRAPDFDLLDSQCHYNSIPAYSDCDARVNAHFLRVCPCMHSRTSTTVGSKSTMPSGNLKRHPTPKSSFVHGAIIFAAGMLAGGAFLGVIF